MRSVIRSLDFTQVVLLLPKRGKCVVRYSVSPNMDAHKQARQWLNKMPEDVFQLWFDGRIDANGWPPVGPSWCGALRGKTLEYWQNLDWRKQTVLLDISRFTPESQRIINGLIEANFTGAQNIFSQTIGDSKERTVNILEYVGIKRSLPSALILIQLDDSYEIVDGSHRLSVFFALQADEQKKHLLSEYQEVWMGYLS